MTTRIASGALASCLGAVEPATGRSVIGGTPTEPTLGTPGLAFYAGIAVYGALYEAGRYAAGGR